MQCICERSCKIDVVFFRNGLISWKFPDIIKLSWITFYKFPNFPI